MTETTQQQFGKLAAQCGQRLPLQVYQSRASFYVGTLDAEGQPYSRESAEYWPQRAQADKALSTGTFTQRVEP